MRFVLIDKLMALEPGRRAEATKVFAPDDPLFDDHFPGFPVVPGVLLTEAMGQTAGWLVAATLRFSRWPLLSAVDRARFHRLVRPGEEIRLAAELQASRDADFEVTAAAMVDGERAATARLLFHGFEIATADAPSLEAWARRVFREIGGETLLQDRGVLPAQR